MTTPTRRTFLGAVGAGALACAISPRASARLASGRVFVHPERSGADLVEILDGLGATEIITYEHFDFVAATVPGGELDVLEAHDEVALVEADEEIEAVGGRAGASARTVDEQQGDDADERLTAGSTRRLIGDDGLAPIDDGLPIGDDDGDSDSDDSSCGLLDSPQRPSWGYERIGADEIEGTGTGVNVAILDTGIETDHCDLEVAGGRNFTDGVENDDYEDRNGHGTHVAGIVAARDTDHGVLGVAPEADLYAVKVLDDDGSGLQSWMALGIDWCIENEIEICNLSLGGDAGSSAIEEVIERAESEGHLLVGAAGNDGNDGPESCDEENVGYPASHDAVVATSAMGENDSLADYSSVGPEIDVMAPGSNVRSTYLDDGYTTMSGTSMATPHVSGVAALLWAERDADGPGPNEEVGERLLETAETVLGTCAEGDGLVDAANAVDAEEGEDGAGGGDDDAHGDEGNGDGRFDDSAGSGVSDTGLPSAVSDVRERISAFFEAILDVVLRR